MATKLDKTIKREIEMDGQAYMVTISPDGVKLTQKGFRKGREMSWRALWTSGSEEGGGCSRRRKRPVTHAACVQSVEGRGTPPRTPRI